MWKKFRCHSIACLMVLLGVACDASAVTCSGRFPNPVTDICWWCMFPIYLGSGRVTVPGQLDNGDPPPPVTCQCPAPPPLFVRYGLGMSFWEPARIAEVVRTPFCSPTMNGKVMGKMAGVPEGTNGTGRSDSGGNGSAFYHLHWFTYPVVSWLSMITSGTCGKSETFDMAYITEVDPLWHDDELSFILNPEAILFANPIAQAACIADSVTASLMGFGLDPLFWCSGSQGSVYPLDGNVAGHVGGIDSSLAIVHRHLFKMHRTFQAMDTSTYGAICADVPQPIMRKNQYKQQMLFPLPQTLTGLGFGVPSAYWGWGREFPYAGEDFSYLIWRKRICCAF